MNLKNITADKLVALYKNRDLTVTEVIRNVYEEIDRVDKDVRAFLSINPERALDEARRADEKIKAGETKAGEGGPAAAKPTQSTKTRAERKSETAAAVKAGETPKAGEGGPAGGKTTTSSKTRAERKAETAAAVKAGETPKAGEAPAGQKK